MIFPRPAHAQLLTWHSCATVRDGAAGLVWHASLMQLVRCLAGCSACRPLASAAIRLSQPQPQRQQATAGRGQTSDWRCVVWCSEMDRSGSSELSATGPLLLLLWSAAAHRPFPSPFPFPSATARLLAERWPPSSVRRSANHAR